MPNEGDFNDIGYFQIPIMGIVNKLEETLSEDSTESEYENPDCPYSSDLLEEFSDDEINISGFIKDWLSQISAQDRQIVKELQDGFKGKLPSLSISLVVNEESRSVNKVIGDVDDLGNLHGEVEIFYDNGDYVWADYIHGVKEGPASLVYKNGDHILGSFRNGQLEGLVEETLDYCDYHNVKREVIYRHGVRHGFYREFGPDNKFWALGKYKDGVKWGKHWKRVDGNAFLFGEVDEDNKPHGKDILYFYPDICTILRGNYNHGKLEMGDSVHLSGITLEHGIIQPLILPTFDEKIFTYDNPTRYCISKNPHTRDPYEMRHVFVRDSQIPFAGEGLWAKTDIKGGDLVALFNGVKQRQLWGVASQKKGWSDYRICWGKELDLDILPQHISLENYRATLAHKACHSFRSNAHFEPFWHPRFGNIMSIVSSKDIKAGEEILTNYNYSLSKSPDWYREGWFLHLREVEEWSEEKIYSWMQKEVRNSGISVRFIPPVRGSERFRECCRCQEHVSAWDAAPQLEDSQICHLECLNTNK